MVEIDLDTLIMLAEQNECIGFKIIQNQITLWKKNNALNRWFWYHYERTDRGFTPISMQWEGISREPTNLIHINNLSSMLGGYIPLGRSVE